MKVCYVCKRKFKSRRGLHVHMAKAHHIHGPRKILSMRIFRYFRLLDDRKWTDARRFLEWAEERKVEEKWKMGYLNGLKGMLIALVENHSPPFPYILEMKNYDEKRLKEAKEEFLKLWSKPLNTEFDKGYFQAWRDYISHLLRQKGKSAKPQV